MKVIPAGISWKALPGRRWEVTIRREPEVIYELGDYPELSALGRHTEGAGVAVSPSRAFRRFSSPAWGYWDSEVRRASADDVAADPAAWQAYHRIA